MFFDKESKSFVCFLTKSQNHFMVIVCISLPQETKWFCFFGGKGAWGRTSCGGEEQGWKQGNAQYLAEQINDRMKANLY